MEKGICELLILLQTFMHLGGPKHISNFKPSLTQEILSQVMLLVG